MIGPDSCPLCGAAARPGELAEAGWLSPEASERLVRLLEMLLEKPELVAPSLVAGVAACMLEANPSLTPWWIRELLTAAAEPVAGAPPERQGAGALDAGRAVALAAAAHDGYGTSTSVLVS